jgi:Fic family protein
MALEILAHIERLRADWMALQPIDLGHAAKLHQKMRLEWNYNSNHIEGNTLTYGETELLLIFDQTKGDHEFREYEEMKGHDVALKMVEDLANDKERELTESFICNLNKLILKEPFYKEAITPDGQTTQRLIKIGEYKSQPNSVILQNGEMFHYASPTETPAKMYDLLQWYRQAAADGSHHPITLAAELHYRFVLIHPFDDGNGRISRLLMNYHLLRHGYPPVIIKSADKKNYLRSLHEADTGNVAAFVDYVAEQLVWSYEISIKASKGEIIDEPDDWEKKIELLKKSTRPDLVANQKKSIEVLHQVWDNSLLPFYSQLLADLIKIGSLFAESTIRIWRNQVNSNTDTYTENSSIEKMITSIYMNTVSWLEEDRKLVDAIRVQFEWNGYKYAGINTFNSGFDIEVVFQPQKYCIKFDTTEKRNIEMLYSQILSESESKAIIDEIKEHVLAQIKRWAKT